MIGIELVDHVDGFREVLLLQASVCPAQKAKHARLAFAVPFWLAALELPLIILAAAPFLIESAPVLNGLSTPRRHPRNCENCEFRPTCSVTFAMPMVTLGVSWQH